MDAEFQTLESRSKDTSQSQQFLGGQKSNGRKKNDEEGWKENRRKKDYEGEDQ
jgi:hypothetical protein